MDDDRDAGLLTRAQNGSKCSSPGESGPDAVCRGRAHHDDACALVECPLELFDGPAHVGERDVGRREDAVLVVEAPVFFEPTVEGAERDPDGLGIVDEQLFVEHAEGREQPDRLETELVEHRDARVAVAVLGPDGLALGEHLDRVLALGVAAEVVVQRAGLGDRGERRVHHGVAHAPADDVVLAAVDLAPLHGARPEPRVEVPGEGVERLVVVVVGVERLVVELAHSRLLRVERKR